MDGAADWIRLLSGHDPKMLEEVMSNWLAATPFALWVPREKSTMGWYRLAFTTTSQDAAVT